MGASRQTVIIADTSGLISLCLPGDHNHAVAVNAAEQLKSDHRDILIPAAVFVEFLTSWDAKPAIVQRLPQLRS
jgi:hypothetical protein